MEINARVIHMAAIEAARHGDKTAVLEGLAYLIDSFREGANTDVVGKYEEILRHATEDEASLVEVCEQLEELFEKLDKRFAAAVLIVQCAPQAQAPVETLHPQPYSLN